MQRKWTVLAVAFASFVALAVGFSVADEDSELHKLMEQVNAKNAAITKAVRTPVQFKKAQADGSVAKHAEELVKLGTKAKPYQDAVQKAKDVKNPGEQWNTLMDDFIKKSKDLADVAGKSDVTAEQAKSAHAAVKKSCSECHMIFRIEE